MSAPQIVTPNLENEEHSQEEMINLTFDHSAELLCFTAKLSSDLGEPKTLCEALSGEDAARWKVAIGKEIMNFLKQDAWKRYQCSRYMPRDVSQSQGFVQNQV